MKLTIICATSIPLSSCRKCPASGIVGKKQPFGKIFRNTSSPEIKYPHCIHLFKYIDIY